MGNSNSPKKLKDEQMIPQTSEKTPDDQTVNLGQVTEDEIVRRIQDETRAEAQDIFKILLSQQSENPNPKKTPEQLFEEMIRPKIHELIMASELMQGDESCTAMLVRSDNPDCARYEKSMVDALMQAFIKENEAFANLFPQPAENPNLKKTPEQLFKETVRPKIHDVVMALGLAPVIENCRLILVNSNNSNRASHEKAVAKMLMRALKKDKVPFKKWAFFPDAMIGENAANCSASALIFGIIMNEEFGIKTDYANPLGHAATVVTFSDGKTYYFDPRNQESQKIKLGTPRTRDGFDIHRTRVLDFGLLPISKFEHGAMLTILENMRALKDELGKDPEADLTAERYSNSLDFDFAEQYMKGNFLSDRDDEDEWKTEKEDIRYNRMLFKYFHLIPNH